MSYSNLGSVQLAVNHASGMRSKWRKAFVPATKIVAIIARAYECLRFHTNSQKCSPISKTSMSPTPPPLLTCKPHSLPSPDIRPKTLCLRRSVLRSDCSHLLLLRHHPSKTRIMSCDLALSILPAGDISRFLHRLCLKKRLDLVLLCAFTLTFRVQCSQDQDRRMILFHGSDGQYNLLKKSWSCR